MEPGILQEKKWSDLSLLKSIRNPSGKEYKIVMTSHEVTFLGVPAQPDFAVVRIEFVPGEKVVELKSLKAYFFDFRQRVLSYERFLNVVFDDLTEVYVPKRLRVVVTLNSRGGISSELVADSERR